VFNGQLSEEERRFRLLEIKQKLEKEGFKTTWRDPFFEWLRPTPPEIKEADNPIADVLYIPDPPVPKITPFDLATIAVRIDNQISFQLSLYYCKVLEEAIEADVINQIYDQHASSWTPPMAVQFNDIASQYSLHWDSEYDEYIEDSLYGFFPVDSTDQIISLLRVIWNNDRELNQIQEEAKG
jgi:hypothetical protein